jgi:hypothetical protein
VKIISLYGTYLGANFLSNCLIHPNQKLDYGILNKAFLDERGVDKPFWGTRLPHLLMVPATLTFYDLTIGAFFARFCGLVSFAATPAAWLLNLYTFTWLAVGSFFAIDSAMNPALEGKRVDNFTSLLKPLTIGMGLQWHAQMLADLFRTGVGGAAAYLRGIVAVSLVFLPVKALAFGDFMQDGLSETEKKMNGLVSLPRPTSDKSAD